MTMELVFVTVALLAGIGIGFGVNFFIRGKTIGDARIDKARIIEKAQKEAANIEAEAQLKAKEIIFAAKTQSDAEAKERLKEVSSIEKRIHQREELIDNKLSQLDKREQEIRKSEQSLADRTRHVDAMKAEIETLRTQQIEKLEEISGKIGRAHV